MRELLTVFWGVASAFAAFLYWRMGTNTTLPLRVRRLSQVMCLAFLYQTLWVYALGHRELVPQLVVIAVTWVGVALLVWWHRQERNEGKRNDKHVR